MTANQFKQDKGDTVVAFFAAQRQVF